MAGHGRQGGSRTLGASPRAVALLLLIILAPLPALAQEVPVPGLEEEALPDLVPTSLRVQTNHPHEAQPTELCVDVRNVGEGDVVNAFDTVFLIDAIDEGGVRTQPPLRSGNAVTICRTFTIPAGDHQFTVRVDPSGGSRGEVLESDETNNRGAIREFHVASEPRPDLAFYDARVHPRVGGETGPQAFATSIINQGNMPSEAGYMDIRDETGYLARNYPIRALAPGEIADVALITRPSVRPPGNYTAEFFIDPEGALVERRTDNNYASYAYSIAERPLPDLIVSEAMLNGTLVERRTLRLDVRVENNGERTTGKEGLATLIAVNETGHNRTLGNQTFPILPVHTGAAMSFHFNLLAGNHTLRLIVDPLDAIIERNTTNNVWEANVTIDAPERASSLPNLVALGLDAAPDDPKMDEVVTMTAWIANAGDEVATDVLVAFYVDDRQVGTATARRLAPDQQATVEITWPPGDPAVHTLHILVDPEGAIEEYIEDDNLVTRTFELRSAAAPPPRSDDPPTDQPPEEKPPAQPPEESPKDPVVELSPVEIADLRMTTRQDPGKLYGTATVTLRNPNLDAVNAATVRFLVDGQNVKEILVQSLPSAATRAISSGELELPPGRHDVRVEVRMPGSSTPSASSETTYDAEAGERGLPAPGLLLVLLAVAGVATIIRRKA